MDCFSSFRLIRHQNRFRNIMRVLCKFFAHGACLKGEYCEFSHSWSDPPNNVCTFYQRGVCAYGSRCRYEHVKASSAQPSGSSSVENSQQPLHFVPAPHLQVTSPRGVSSLPSSPLEPLPSSTSLLSQSKPAWNQDPESHDFLEDYNLGEPSSVQPADRPICPFAAAGNCPKGEKCPHIHGDLCPTCGKHCLHPFRPMERDEHMKMCEKKQKDLEALKYSQEIECSVCLERVLLKPTPAERKFGILSECDHPFCISCIRNWRSSSPATGMDMNSALRTCPICRKLSYFVIPSVIWYCSKEEKKDIVDSYKAKLRSIDCRHFNFGNGNCPFGTSCFYKHTVKSGSYAWKYHCPPPPPPRSNNIDQDSMFSNIFRELASFIEIAEELEELEENVEPEDLQFEGLEPWQWDFFHAQMGYDSDELGYYDSDEEEETYL